jgi:hypothetical protein
MRYGINLRIVTASRFCDLPIRLASQETRSPLMNLVPTPGGQIKQTDGNTQISEAERELLFRSSQETA